MLSPMQLSLLIEKIVSPELQGRGMFRQYPIIWFVINLAEKSGWNLLGSPEDNKDTPAFYFFPSPSTLGLKYQPHLFMRITFKGNEKVVDFGGLSYVYAIKVLMDTLTNMGYFG